MTTVCLSVIVSKASLLFLLVHLSPITRHKKFLFLPPLFIQRPFSLLCPASERKALFWPSRKKEQLFIKDTRKKGQKSFSCSSVNADFERRRRRQKTRRLFFCHFRPSSLSSRNIPIRQGCKTTINLVLKEQPFPLPFSPMLKEQKASWTFSPRRVKRESKKKVPKKTKQKGSKKREKQKFTTSK